MIAAGTKLGAVTAQLDGGPVVGQVDPAGRLINLGKLEGWWDPTPTSGTDTQKVNEHGAFLGPAYYGPRVINLEARIDGFNPGDSLATARSLINSLTLDALTTLTVTDELETLTARVRQEGDPVLLRQGNRMVVSLSMKAPDPRRYTGAASLSTGLPTSAGGFSLNGGTLSLPIALGGTSVDGSLNVTNLGDVETNPVFTLYGPVPAPWTITDALGRQLTGADAVPAGRTLVIDVGARTALLDGIANRVVTGTWPTVRPGANTYLFKAASYDAGALLTITYRSARR